MRILEIGGRAALAVGDGYVDVAEASGGRFDPDVQRLYARWDEFSAWAGGFDGPATGKVEGAEVGCPVPRPAQIFAIGMNYRAHAVEADLPIPTIPVVFTKFPAAVTGPYATVAVPPQGPVDFEAELVVVIGRRAEDVTVDDAWSHVAGLTVGQDLSERAVQWSGDAPQQFNLGKSLTGFAPIGPAVVSPDEFADPADLQISCTLNGVEMQNSRTSDLIFSIPVLIAYLSSFLPLLPGDAIFTGTPSGIGFTRDPKVLLGPGDELVTEIEGIGALRNTFTTRTGRRNVL